VIQNEPTVEPTLEELAKMPEADVDTLLAEDPEQASVFQSSLTDEMPDETPEAPSTPEDTV
jgi:hypothetical protein